MPYVDWLLIMLGKGENIRVGNGNSLSAFWAASARFLAALRIDSCNKICLRRFFDSLL